MRSLVFLLSVQWALAQQGVWRFEKISLFDRKAEPVAIGMPFPKGLFHDGDHLELDGGAPVQTTITGRWPDGSVRWAFIRALVDLPGNQEKEIRWRVVNGAPDTKGVEVRRLADGALAVNTGPLEAVIPASGFLPFREVRLNGRPVTATPRGFAIRTYSTANSGPLTLQVLESGPVAAVIRAAGRHGPPESPFAFSAILTFWKGKPYVALDYRVLKDRGEAETTVEAWSWSADLTAATPRLRTGTGHYNTRVQASATRLRYDFGPENFRFDSVEHAFQSYWGDFWCDWSGEDAGLTVTLRQAQQNYPKAMEVTSREMSLHFYPAGGEPLRFPLGAAKTHQMLFHFHPIGTPLNEIIARSLQYQIPDVPKLDSEWYARAAVWDEKVFEGPRSRRVEAMVYDVLDNRPVGMGIWNFGDEVDWGYTGQGRGRDDVVWLNNEYDFTHWLFVAYARSGERRFLDYAFANALHWRDVDIAHVAADPRRRGGHIAHSARHVTGGVTPSHQWVEGLIDAYHFFGDRDAWDAALGVGDNILRQRAMPQYRDPGNASTRDMGWALRALLALHRETGEHRYLDAARPIVELFRRWHAELPGLLAPYTDHSLVRVNFMNALTLVSLARYYRYAPDQALKKLILEATGDLVRNGRNANGLFYYKELPSLKHQGATLLPLQLLAEAYRLSGDRRYLEAGLPEVEHALALGMRFAVHTGAAEKFATPTGGYSRVLFYPPGGKHLGTNLMPLLEFLHAAGDAELIRQLDSQLRLP